MKVQVTVIDARKREGVSKDGRAYSFLAVMFQDAEGNVFEGNLKPERAGDVKRGLKCIAVFEPWGKFREPHLSQLLPA
jgi:hypothetical protein